METERYFHEVVNGQIVRTPLRGFADTGGRACVGCGVVASRRYVEPDGFGNGGMYCKACRIALRTDSICRLPHAKNL